MSQNTARDIYTINAFDLLNKQFPSSYFLMDPWLQDGDASIIWAAAGVGKSMLALSIAAVAACGGQMGEWSNTTPRKVLYIDGEMRERDVHKRLHSLISSHAVQLNSTDSLRNVKIQPRSGQSFQWFYDLTQQDAQQEIISRCAPPSPGERPKIDLLILDNYSTLSDGLEDENSAVAFKPVAGLITDLRGKGVSTILVHHARKDGQAMRGSQSMEVVFDNIISLRKPDIGSGEFATFDLRFEKVRAQRTAKHEPRRWMLTPSNGWQIDDNIDPQTTMDRVLEAINSLEYASQKELAAALQLSEANISKTLAKLDVRGDLSANKRKDLFTAAKTLRNSGGFEPFPPIDLTADDALASEPF